MFRLPTHLETLVPPPTEQVPQMRPWKGTLILAAPSSPPSAANNVIYCAAAETDGDNSEVEAWPPQFVVQMLNQRPLLPQLKAWLQTHAVPMCMFMPDRLADREAHKRNHELFESLAKTLHDNQFVAIAPWNSPDRAGGGLILYPTVSSRALIVGAVFLQNQFPDFLGVNPRSHVLPVPRGLSYSPSGHAAAPNIAASQRHARGGGPAS